MKKNLLLITMSIFSLNAVFSQRSIDWSVEEIISPTQITHGQQINVHIVCKNNGPNDAISTDSCFGRVYLNNGQLVSNWVYTLLGRDVEVGDTFHMKFSLASVNITGLSFNSTFIAQSLLQNRPDLNLEQQGTITNNSKSVTIPYLNDKGWGVSVANVENNSVIVYPNPAVSNVNIDFAAIQTSDKVSIEIYDLQGKLVYQSDEKNINGSFEVNVSEFEKGIYMVKIINGETNLTSKLVVE